MDGDLQHDPLREFTVFGKIEEVYDLVSVWRHSRRSLANSAQIPDRAAKLDDGETFWRGAARLSALRSKRTAATSFKKSYLYASAPFFFSRTGESPPEHKRGVPIEIWSEKRLSQITVIGRTIRVFLDC